MHDSQAAKGIVLTGVGRSFCTGIDLQEIGGSDGATKSSVNPHLQRLVNIYRWFLTTKLPTVVLARGYAAGGGTGLVAGAKTAIVSSDFRLKLPGGNLARFAAVALPLFNLRAGSKPPGDAVWLGKELDAVEAHRLGLVDRVVPEERLNDLVEGVRSGDAAPELFQEKGHDQRAISRALLELDQFLQQMDGDLGTARSYCLSESNLILAADMLGITQPP